jgi:hypothetical protein
VAINNSLLNHKSERINTMTDHDTDSDEGRVHSMEPFPEPNTYPIGWNMDSILAPKPASKEKDSEPLPDWYEYFHEPNTYPPCWDY